MKRRGCSPSSKSKHCPPPLLADCRGTAVHHSAAGPPQHHPAAASSAPCRRGRRRPWSLPRQRPHKTDLYQPFFFSPLFCFPPTEKHPRRPLRLPGTLPVFLLLGLLQEEPQEKKPAVQGRATSSFYRVCCLYRSSAANSTSSPTMRAQMLPLWASAMPRAMDSPMPKPPVAALREGSAR